MLLGPLSDKFLCQNKIFKAILSLRQKKSVLGAFYRRNCISHLQRKCNVYTENNLDALYGGGGGRGPTAVMPFTGITILYPLCYRENYVLGALSEKTVYVVLYQRKLGGMVSASSSKKDVLGLSEGNNRVLLMKSMGDIDREEVFDPTVFTE